MFETSFLNKRFWVRISAGKSEGLKECIYYRNDLRFQILDKWMWYFKYREALYRIHHPKYLCKFEYGSYDFVEPKVERLERLKNEIKGKRATITKYKGLVAKAKQEWNELFPIDDDIFYKKAIAKIKRIEAELEALLTTQKELSTITTEKYSENEKPIIIDIRNFINKNYAKQN